ncbi:hypothetical protein FBU59_002417 [Linderina macrospora]|uniref:Uncharacterized protein n=1 Tax=Linderina macrospora TaxID=4868 RepID=A0ACC1JB77_9FUNG|nr:hypothetical protein FBU59_002417 [Linderina macrospora]
MYFAYTKPHLFYLLPDWVFSVLLLECYVECDIPDCTCDKKHIRDWMTNLPLLKKYDKLGLVTEFRVVIFNNCRSPMRFDRVMKEIADELPEVMPNVRSIKLLGYGIFTAETVKYPELNTTDAVLAAKTITKLFPNVTDLRYHLFRTWAPTPNFRRLGIDIYPLYEYLLDAYASQLLHVQMLIPFPPKVTKLFESLTSVSINTCHARPREDLPRIPIRYLRIVELFQIEDVIPWWLFETVRNELNFESLEDLRLEFIHEAENTVDDLGCDVPIRFPKLNNLHVTNSFYVYTDIYGYFRDRDLECLTIRDVPTNFKKIKEHALERARLLTISHPQGTRPTDQYPVEEVEHLYNLPSNAEEAVLGFIEYPMPKMIAWDNLRKLRMSASIADKHGLANLLAQLPLLEMLFIDCLSMSQDDAATTRFPDQTTTFRKLGQVMDPDDNSSISETLEHVELMVRGNFDLNGFCELLSRLPYVKYVKINHNMMFHVMYKLEHMFGVKRQILFESFPM